MNGEKGLAFQSSGGSSPFPPSSSSPQSPCALFPALARLFYTQIPMRRSSCPLECQVSPWDPPKSARPRALTTVTAAEASRCTNLRRGRTRYTHGQFAPPYSPWLDHTRLWPGLRITCGALKKNVPVCLFFLSSWGAVEASTGESGAPFPVIHHPPTAAASGMIPASGKPYLLSHLPVPTVLFPCKPRSLKGT